MAACTSAQYPNRPVRLVVGWPPGGAEINTSSPQQFAAIIRDDLAKWTRLIQASGLWKPDTRP
jgi:tripartite-type tricarboxylate transporter receptor subunit TctC